MFKLTGTVVGYDDFLPAGAKDEFRQFHVVVEEDSTRDRVRLRKDGLVSAVPILLSDFGKGADLDEVRDLLQFGARIEFQYYNLSDDQRAGRDYHPMDILVYRITEIQPAQLRATAVRPRARLELVHSA